MKRSASTQQAILLLSVLGPSTPPDVQLQLDIAKYAIGAVDDTIQRFKSSPNGRSEFIDMLRSSMRPLIDMAHQNMIQSGVPTAEVESFARAVRAFDDFLASGTADTAQGFPAGQYGQPRPRPGFDHSCRMCDPVRVVDGRLLIEPQFVVDETATQTVVTIEMPGIDRQTLQVTSSDGALFVSARLARPLEVYGEREFDAPISPAETGPDGVVRYAFIEGAVRVRTHLLASVRLAGQPDKADDFKPDAIEYDATEGVLVVRFERKGDDLSSKVRDVAPPPSPAAPAPFTPPPAPFAPAPAAQPELSNPAYAQPAAPATEEPAAPAAPAAPATPATPATEEPAASAAPAAPAAPATEEPATEEPSAPATEEPSAPATEEPAAPAAPSIFTIG